jgi:hypothetical protein
LLGVQKNLCVDAPYGGAHQKGVARDIASQPIMVIPPALAMSITIPDYPAILHVALLGLGELLPLWCVTRSSLTIWY